MCSNCRLLKHRVASARSSRAIERVRACRLSCGVGLFHCFVLFSTSIFSTSYPHEPHSCICVITVHVKNRVMYSTARTGIAINFSDSFVALRHGWQQPIYHHGVTLSRFAPSFSPLVALYFYFFFEAQDSPQFSLTHTLTTSAAAHSVSLRSSFHAAWRE